MVGKADVNVTVHSWKFFSILCIYHIEQQMTRKVDNLIICKSTHFW